MPPAFSAGNQSVSVSGQDIVTAALQELNVVATGEAPSYEDSALALQKLQRLIDLWNADRDLIFSVAFTLFNLQANHGPHTIGPGGDFNVPSRPVKVNSASWILNPNTTNPVDSPIMVRDKDWWAANPLKTLVSSIITHLYYEPSFPLGALNFWPISNIINPVRLELWNPLNQAISLQTSLGLPPGYWDAIVMELARTCVGPFKAPWEPTQETGWNRAMRIIEENNFDPPRIDTDSGGLPNSRRTGRPDFNFLTGLRE